MASLQVSQQCTPSSITVVGHVVSHTGHTTDVDSAVLPPGLVNIFTASSTTVMMIGRAEGLRDRAVVWWVRRRGQGELRTNRKVVHAVINSTPHTCNKLGGAGQQSEAPGYHVNDVLRPILPSENPREASP